MDDTDVSLPKGTPFTSRPQTIAICAATLQKMIKELMPDLRCNPDTVDLIVECCTESNDISNRERKNTIHPEHVLQALSDLGFGEFIPEVKESWENWKANHKNTTHQRKQRKPQGLSESELIAAQKMLLDEARARSNSFQGVQEMGDHSVDGALTDPMGQQNDVTGLSVPLATFHSMLPLCSTKLEDLQSPFSQTSGQTAKERHLAMARPNPSSTTLEMPPPISLESRNRVDHEAAEQQPIGDPIVDETHKTERHERTFDVDPRRSDTAMSIDTVPDEGAVDGTS